MTEDDVKRGLQAYEHHRLEGAAARLIRAIDDDFTGDLPAALEALAEVFEDLVFAENPMPRLVEALEGATTCG